MGGPGRIAPGLLTDATRPVGFRFDGRRMSGVAGDTLASALLANGAFLKDRFAVSSIDLDPSPDLPLPPPTP